MFAGELGPLFKDVYAATACARLMPNLVIAHGLIRLTGGPQKASPRDQATQHGRDHVMASSNAKTADEYVAELPPDRRAAIAAVRKVILDNLPDGYVETM